MEITTTDGRLLFAVKIGELGKASNRITCQDANGQQVAITFADVSFVSGCYYMPPVAKEVK